MRASQSLDHQPSAQEGTKGRLLICDHLLRWTVLSIPVCGVQGWSRSASE